MQDLLAPANICDIRLDITSRCNLRCVYCAVSQSDYVGLDMGGDLLSASLKAIRNLARFHDIRAIGVNGHGETTYAPNWTETCLTLLEEGHALEITSNFAKEFSREELGVLSRTKAIAISIDSNNRQLLGRMRRRVDVRQVVANIVAVRAAARRNRYPAPQIGFASGLYDKNSLFLEDFAYFAIVLGVAFFDFWNLNSYPYENTDVAVDDRAIALDELSDNELVPRLAAIKRGLEILNQAGVHTKVHGNFVSVLAKKRGLLYD
jgi:MoaA/NifB/PqqE/SkfB family radical SAM enzyme